MIQTKKITEGALLTAIVGMVLLLDRQFVGFFQEFIYWILPLPLAIYTIRYGFKNALLPSISMIIIAFIVAFPTTVYFVCVANLIGLVYGVLVRFKKSNWLIIAVICLICFVSNVLTMILFAALFGYDLNTEFATLANIIVESGVVNDKELALSLFRSLLPAIIFLTSLLETFIIHIITNRVCVKLKIEVQRAKPFIYLQLPKLVGIGALLGYYVIMYILVVYKFDQHIYDLLFSFDQLLRFVFIINGISCIGYILFRLGHYRFFIIIVILSLLLPVVTNFMFVMGVIDSIFDYRNKFIKK